MGRGETKGRQGWSAVNSVGTAAPGSWWTMGPVAMETRPQQQWSGQPGKSEEQQSGIEDSSGVSWQQPPPHSGASATGESTIPGTAQATGAARRARIRSRVLRTEMVERIMGLGRRGLG